MNFFQSNYFKTEFGDIPAYTFRMKVSEIVLIHYIAKRGFDDEQGAVQRILSTRRIDSIKEYILEGNQFFGSFILNWMDKNHQISFVDNEIKIPLIPASAQVIDGQHRLSGLEAAIEERESIADDFVIVTLCVNLSTKDAARIFLNINTEQKPVPKSLIYDLFGEVIEDPEHALNRARDIARSLNDNPKSPFYRFIKFPGTPKGVGRIELSTFVNAIKPHLEKDGKIPTVNLKSLQHQSQALNNFFEALRQFYSDKDLWNSTTKNPFLKGAGFSGAMDYFINTLILKCAERQSFEVSTIKTILNLDVSDLLVWQKGLDGKTARKRITDYLNANQMKSLAKPDAFKF